eukprot:5179009-Prymnesium_polylepis.1
MVGDAMSYFCSFLSVATTNLVASDVANQRAASVGSSGGDPAQTFDTAKRLAVLAGIASATAQTIFGRAVLTRYTAARSAALVTPAFEYVRIRALGAPAALLVRVSTATSLATKDPLTPLVAVTASGVLNLVLDVLLVPLLGMGIRGAAWATVASEVACAAVVVHTVQCRLQRRGWHARFQGPLLPSRKAVATYAAFAKPLLMTLAGKIATYSALAHVATTVSVTSTAAHRVLMGVYWLMWPFAEVCSQLSQAFLPGATRTAPLLRRLLRGGALVGVACGASAATVLACAPQLFTSDAA